MKYIFLFSFSTFFFCLFAQNHEVDINYHITINSNRSGLNKDLSWYNDQNIERAISKIDQGITLNYAYKIWKKVGLFATAGFGVYNSTHTLPLSDASGRQLGNVNFEMNRFNYQFGLRQEFRLYKGKVLIQLGVTLLDRLYFNKNKNYVSSIKKSHNTNRAYSYNVNTFHSKYEKSTELGVDNRGVLLFLDYSINIKFKLYRGLYFSIGANYSRNNLFYYDYEYKTYDFFPNTEIIIDSQKFENDAGGFNRKHPVRDHYLYLNFGVSYKFNWKKKDKK